MPANPLPSDGVIGKLTPEQNDKLKEFWAEFLRLIDEAPEEGSADGTGKAAPPPDDPKAASKDIPKDDNAKERMRAEEETKNAKAAFALYGSKKFIAAFWRLVAMDDPDGIVLRFLRARKWNVSAGVAMLSSCVKWRLESDVEKIFFKGEEGMRNAEGFIKQMQMGKSYTQGTDKSGRPIVYIHVAKHKTSDQSAKALEDFVLFQMESVRCLFSPPVDKISMVFNMTGFGLANMDWRCILFIVKCLEAYYPESLNVMLIHSAPWVFQGIWKLLAPMLDPVVRAKVQMTKNTDDLLEHIDKKHLDKQLGGSNDWEWKYPEIEEGENEKQKDTETREALQAQRDAIIAAYTECTKEWSKSRDPNVEKKRKYIQCQLRRQYFELDPYIRGRGAYHRNGNIVGNGLVCFEYPGVQPGGEWEFRGYETCREESQRTAADLKKELVADGVEVPDFDDAKAAPSKPKRSKSKRRNSTAKQSDYE